MTSPRSSRISVPFEEDERDPKTWYMDHDYIESMNDMFKKVNAREKLVGWYHSGPRLRASDLEINQVVKRYVRLFLPYVFHWLRLLVVRETCNGHCGCAESSDRNPYRCLPSDRGDQRRMSSPSLQCFVG